jgi:hypothetical protein
MDGNDAEAAYCRGRIQRSTALAIASTESCARRSHETMAILYERRLIALTRVHAVPPIWTAVA